MKNRWVYSAILAALAAGHPAVAAPQGGAVDAVCSGPAGERVLHGVSVGDATDPRGIDIRSGPAARSIALADIETLTFTAPANRIRRFAPAHLKLRSGEELDAALELRSADRTLDLEGVGEDGKRGRIDVLDCTRIAFKAGT